MKKTAVILTGLMVFGVTTSALAHEHEDGEMHQIKKHAQHMEHDGHHDMNAHDMSEHSDMDMGKSSSMFLKKKEVDGYTVTFHVMPAKKEMVHGGSHTLMVKIEQDGKEVSDVLINSKVFFPNKTTDSKMLMKMNGWFMNGYDLGEGKHGILVLFKTADGKKHKTSVYYPEEK